jgi:hypothetical protein
MHDEGNGDFQVLPSHMIQLEEDLKVRFIERSDSEKIRSIPVAWTWYEDGINAMAVCTQVCQIVTLQSGGEAHKKMHGH